MLAAKGQVGMALLTRCQYLWALNLAAARRQRTSSCVAVHCFLCRHSLGAKQVKAGSNLGGAYPT